MVSWILNLKLRIKLLLAFGSLLLLNVLMMLKAASVYSEMKDYQKASKLIDVLHINTLEIENSIKVFTYEGYKSTDFQKNGISVHITQNKESLSSARNGLTELSTLAFKNIRTSSSKISSTLLSLENNFTSLVTTLRQRGFKDFGLEGKLRTAIHQVENSPFQYNKADMLMLRRHEKDFFLRRDLKYRDEFNKKVDLFISDIQKEKTSLQRDEIIGLLSNYRTSFNEVVQLDEKIGLQDSGLKATLDSTLTQLKLNVSSLNKSITEESLTFEKNAQLLLLILFSIQLVAGIVLAIIYADQITKAVKELKRAIQSFADGVFPQPLNVRSKEEIGITKASFNQLMDRIRAAQDYAIRLGDGKLNNAYPEKYQDDVLAQALIKTQNELKKAANEQKIVNWTNTGVAKLNSILNVENQSLAFIGDQFIKFLVQYLDVNQGALYIIKSEEQTTFAERLSTYAYGKKKIIDHRIEEGQGLIGQVMLEKSLLVLTEIPNGYVKITSGLGEATPSFVLLCPLLVKHEILGIVEIASFTKLDAYQIQFIEIICGNVAVILSNQRSGMQTKKLLDEAQQQAQQVAAQEEEIRQNAEEMQAITEQLERDKKQLMDEVVLLRSVRKPEWVEN